MSASSGGRRPSRGSSGSRKTTTKTTLSSKRTARKTTRPSVSFLFIVNELQVNEDPRNGVIPRVDENGRWIPPVFRAGFYAQTAGRVYRWRDGVVTAADGYQWHSEHINATTQALGANGTVYAPNNVPLDCYKATTVFYCNPWTQFLTAFGDAGARDMTMSTEPNHRWWPLTFRHDRQISRVDVVGEEYLAGTGATWVDQLVPNAYNNYPPSHQSAGLAGDLPTVISLVAFSCPYDQLDDVLLVDRAWQNHQWIGHTRQTGRSGRRGVISSVYLDPENNLGSTNDTLYHLEWTGEPIFR